MKVMVEDLEVLFPYDYIYPEQYLYMIKLKQSLTRGIVFFFVGLCFAFELLIDC